MNVTRGVYAVVAISIVGATLWFYRGRHDKKIDKAIVTKTLNPADEEKYIIDIKHHSITRISRDVHTGADVVAKTFLNTHGPVSITEEKGGKVVIVERTWGTIHEPFIGVAFGSDIRLRAALGLDLFYWQRWELGGGLLASSNIHDTRMFAHVGYNVYGNALVSVAVDNHTTVHLIASIRF